MSPYPFDVDFERGDRQPDHALQLVLDTGADGLRDLGELEAVLDGHATRAYVCTRCLKAGKVQKAV